MTRMWNFELPIIYLKKKAQFMYNSFSDRKNRIFEEKNFFFRIFKFLHRRVPPLDIFGDLRYFQKKFENLKNSFSRTSLTWNGTKSWILVTLAHLARKWQTGLWPPGQICPPLFQIGLRQTLHKAIAKKFVDFSPSFSIVSKWQVFVQVKGKIHYVYTYSFFMKAIR